MSKATKNQSRKVAAAALDEKTSLSRGMTAHERFGDDTGLDLGNSIGIREDDVTLSYGTSLLLTNTTINFAPGKRYGIVARNGLGKSALLHRMNSVKISATKMLITQEQELQNLDLNPFQILESSHVELITAKRRYNELEMMGEHDEDLAEEYSALSQKLVDLEAQKQEAEIIKILNGLGFTTEDRNKPVRLLSGGWRKRVVLATAVYLQPEFLMLDEPTNHLDLEAVLWLETYLLQKYTTKHGKRPKTLIVVSHNVEFMQTLCDTITTIDKKKLFYYNLDYHAFIERHAALMDVPRLDGSFNELKSVYKTLAEGNSPTVKQCRTWKIDQKHFMMIADMFPKKEYTQARHKQFLQAYNEAIPDPVNFPLLSPIPLRGSDVVNTISMGFAYPGKELLFSKVELEVNLGDVLCICGANGTGKSTLLRLIADSSSKPTQGVVMRNENLRIGYYSQHITEQLPPMMSALDYIWSVRDKQSSSFNSDTKIFELLTHFGVPSKVVRESSSALSGGQKARVVLAGLCTQRPHLLILDEPTNHLDIDSIRALANSINENEECAFMIITHDPQLVNELERAQIMVLENGKLEEYDGDMDDYKAELLGEMKF